MDNKIGAVILIVITIGGLLFFFKILPSFFEGGSSLLETSKNIKCGNDIQEALRAFKQKMDMQYDIGPEDYKYIFNKGEIEKQYYRDGILYTAFFNIKKINGRCYLRFFKRGKSEPGHEQTTYADYGSGVLTNCQCQ